MFYWYYVSCETTLSAELCEILDSSYHLGCVRVLVVIPGNYLYLIAVIADLGNHGLGSIEERTVLHADNIGRNDRILVVTEGLGSSSLHSSVDAFLGNILALNNSGEDSCGTCGNRNSLSRTDELAVELGDNKADSLSSTGAVGNDVSSACSCSSEVALSVRTVEDHLVAGVSMDRAHDTALDRSIIVESLSHGSEAVCCAGCSRDELVILCKGLLVYAVNDSGEIVACGSRDNDLLSACVDMSLRLLLGAVETCALENNVNADLAPGELGSVSLGIDGKGLAVNCDSALLVISGNSMKVLADYAAVALLSSIILEKVSEHGGLCEIVDSNYLITRSIKHLSECKTTDTAETIDSNFN